MLKDKIVKMNNSVITFDLETSEEKIKFVAVSTARKVNQSIIVVLNNGLFWITSNLKDRFCLGDGSISTGKLRH